MNVCKIQLNEYNRGILFQRCVVMCLFEWVIGFLFIFNPYYFLLFLYPWSHLHCWMYESLWGVTKFPLFLFTEWVQGVHNIHKECVTESVSTRSLGELFWNLYVWKECIDIRKECATEFSDTKSQEGYHDLVTEGRSDQRTNAMSANHPQRSWVWKRTYHKMCAGRDFK